MFTVISLLQHGFIARRSTVTNLCCFTQCVPDIWDKQAQTDTIYLDLCKHLTALNMHLIK